MRVLICRARADAERTAAVLAERGHTGVIAPVLRIVTGQVPRPPGRFDAVLATSAHAFAQEAETLEDLRHRPLFAVGDLTGRAAREAGFRDIRVSRGDAKDLAVLIALTQPRPAHLLYLCGRDRKPATEHSLAAAGYEVTVWEAYAAEPEPAWDETVLQAIATGRLDATLHYSRRSAALALEMAGRAGIGDLFRALAHLCLSRDVAVPLRDAGAPRIAVAARPDEASLLALLGAEAR